MKNKSAKVNARTIFWCLGTTALLGLSAFVFISKNDRPEVAMASWANIGGCGGGGGGGTAGAGKWIGRGATGGRYDIEMLSNTTLGGDYKYSALGITLGTKLRPTTTASMALSFKNNVFEISPFSTAQDYTGTKTHITGGFSDIGFSLAQNFGTINENSLSLSVSLPTGQHDIKRLWDNSQDADELGKQTLYLPATGQPGSGSYTAGINYEYTLDKDWGLWIFGGSYTAAFAYEKKCSNAIAPIPKSRECQEDDTSPLTWKLWDLTHNGHAVRTGATTADGVSLFTHVGYKEEQVTQSIGLTLSLPVGLSTSSGIKESPSYYYDYGPNGPMTKRIKTLDYTMKLSYGLEVFLAQDNYPFFIAFGLPWRLQDVINRKRLVDPQNYVGTVGFKGTFL